MKCIKIIIGIITASILALSVYTYANLNGATNISGEPSTFYSQEVKNEQSWITMKEYNRIKKGMTFDEVVDVCGKNVALTQRISADDTGFITYHCVIKLDNGIEDTVTLNFVGKELRTKSLTSDFD